MDLSFLNFLNPARATQQPTAPNPDAPVPAAPVQQTPSSSPFGWLSQIRNDPLGRQAMIVAGLNMMMAPREDGGLAQVARGIASGLDYYNTMKTSAEDREMAREKHIQDVAHKAEQVRQAQIDNQTRGEANQADIESTRTTTRKTAAEAETAEKKLSAVVDKARAEAEKAKTEAEKEAIALATEKRIEALRKRYPELEESALLAEWENAKLAPQATRADIAYRRAAAGAQSAAAKKTQAELGAAELELEDLRAMTPEERNRLRVSRGSGSVSGQMQILNEYMKNWETMNPPPGDDKPAEKQQWFRERARVHNAQIEQMQQAKLNRISALNAIISNTNPESPEHQNAMAELLQLSQGMQAPGAAAVNGTANSGAAPAGRQVVRGPDGKPVFAVDAIPR